MDQDRLAGDAARDPDGAKDRADESAGPLRRNDQLPSGEAAAGPVGIPPPVRMQIRVMEGRLHFLFSTPILSIAFDRNMALDMARQIRQAAMELPINPGGLIVAGNLSMSGNGHGGRG
jgi:hypothetical protein